MEEQEFYTAKEIAELIRVNDQTIYRLAKRGDLPVHRIGRAMRFRRNDVETFLHACREEEEAERAAYLAPRPERPAAPPEERSPLEEF